ncbi:MAG: Mov34/MPN/PAD-1 family protein [Thermodesulfovibrionia bacterium]
MHLNKEVIKEIYDHAVKEYPYECCGIVTGNINNQVVHRCKNIQDELHAQDPQRYPRDARTAYTIDRTELERIYKEAKEMGGDIIAFYHSHIDCGAFFSETDVAAQTVFGEPEFPDAKHIVISVVNGRVNEMRCFKWDKGKGNFIVVRC